MPQEVVNGVGKTGIRNPEVVVWDANAVAFNTTAGITNDTQKLAINDLVTELKAAGLWTKMQAIYPMVGGTAISHKFNLKDPRDLDAAYRLVFNGGWTHSSTGVTPNGSNAFADSWFNPRNNATLYNQHLSYYSRTQTATATNTDMGAFQNAAPNVYVNSLASLRSDSISVANINANDTTRITYSETDARGLFVVSRTANNSLKYYKNAIIKGTNTTTTTLINPNFQITLGALNLDGGATQYSNKQCAFASIGDGLTDLESSLFYQIVEKFQAALGRNVNASRSFYYNKNYSNEVNAFIFNGGITDATQISAVDTLVTTLKTAGIWTKMKAVYPMVGGTALAHKFNLVNPVDATSAYALTFNGGWTHSSTGALPNGTTGYANTNLVPNTALTTNNHSLSFYSRTNNTTTGMELACQSIQASSTQYGYMLLASYYNAGKSYFQQQCQNTLALEPAVTNTQGFYNGSRTASNMFKSFRNGVLNGTQTNTASAIGSYLPVNSIYLSAWNINVNGTISTSAYSNRECAFASIGDGLTDAEALTFYNAVQAFQTTLGRQV